MCLCIGIVAKLISIHALLAESDLNLRTRLRTVVYFYPRSPCGERRLTNAHNSPNNQISIHALLAESDSVTNGINFCDK